MHDSTVTVLVGGSAGLHPALVGPFGDDLDVVGRTETGATTIDRVLADLPDVLALDVRIAGPDLRAVARRIREWAPATRIVLVTDHDDEQAYTALVAGASAAVTPTAGTTALADAIRGLTRGESLLLPRMARRLLDDLDAWATRSADPLHPPPTLTATEREVLACRAQGAEPAAIASTHGVTPRLVNLHAGFAVAKLHRYVLVSERISAPR